MNLLGGQLEPGDLLTLDEDANLLAHAAGDGPGEVQHLTWSKRPLHRKRAPSR